jgi:glutamine amidotransferase
VPADLKFAIVDYDAGNLRNVQKAFESLGQPSAIASKPEQLQDAHAVIVPGVGSFFAGMTALRERGLAEPVRTKALQERVPTLGICLGMQLFAQWGDEGGETAGLGLLPMRVEKLRPSNTGLRLPHMGWDEVRTSPGSRMFANIEDGSDFYFVHNYRVVVDDQSIVAATCDYGGPFVAAVERENVWAAQFHPEKSQRFGLRLLSNFIEYARTQVLC